MPTLFRLLADPLTLILFCLISLEFTLFFSTRVWWVRFCLTLICWIFDAGCFASESYPFKLTSNSLSLLPLLAFTPNLDRDSSMSLRSDTGTVGVAPLAGRSMLI